MKRFTLLLLTMASFIAHSYGQLSQITVNDSTFFPEDIVIANNVAYVSGLGDGTLRSFDLTQPNPTAQLFAAAEAGFTQRWGVKSDGTILLSILDNANFAGGAPGPAKLAQYDIASRQKTAEWDLPANMVGHTVSIVDGKYYVTDFNSPLIVEVDPATGTVNASWFTSTDWDPTISGIGGTIYDNEGGFYVSQGNKLWYLPISNGTPGTLTEVTVSGLSIIDADGISWVDSQNTLYYATNDTGDPANAGTVYKLVFSDDTTATGSVVATGFDDSSGLWYHEDDGKEYVYVLESQFGALFGINTFEPPFNIEILELSQEVPANLTSTDMGFFPEDIVIANNVAYVSGLGDGTLRAFNLNLANPTGEIFAEADSGYSQRWGVKSDGTILLSILDNANFAGGAPGPAKLAQYDIASRQKTAEWDLPANMVGHTVSIVDGKYYVTDFNSPLIVEVDPATGTVNPSWFTSTDWDPSISGIGGTIYDNEGGFYVSQGNKLWYLPISNGTPGTLTEVTVSGLSIIDADGISWVDSQNTLYYATNDTGDPANAGTVYKLVFSDDTTATGSVVATGFDDSSGLWHHEDDGKEYVYVLESQFGALFGINTFEPPFNIEILELSQEVPANLTSTDMGFFPEDIVIANNVAYVSGLGDGTLRAFNLNLANPTGEIFAEADSGYSQRWGVKSDGTILLSILDNANFAGGAPGPAKLAQYDIASRQKTAEWDLPANMVGHTVSIVDGKYYVTDFNSPLIVEVDPATGTVNPSWFTSTDWDPSISGIGGTIYDNEGGFYVSQGNKLWYLPISNGTPGTLTEVTVSGLSIIDADGISWVDSQNTLYYATNDTGDPANAGTVYKLVFSDDTTATGSVVATGFDDSSGLWHHEDDGKEYVYVLESQFGALFGINTFEPPFNIEILELSQEVPANLTSTDMGFFPEDIVIANNVAYVSGLGDGTLRAFNLNLANPTGEIFAEADSGYSQRWGVKSDGTILLSILDNANFAGGAPGPAKLAQYDIASRQKTAEWDLPANMVGHTVSIVDGKYYVTDFNSPLIVEVDPATGTVNASWFTSTDWDPTISGIGGTIYDNEGGFYVSQGNKLWYLPISNGTPGTLTEVTVSGLSIIDADGISWVDSQNTLYYATNDTGDPANAGTVYKLVFSDDTTATGSVVATGFDDSSGLWYHEDDGKEYVYVLESQFGALFGINTFEPPFNIEILELSQEVPANLTSTDMGFFPEDIVIANNVAYVSGLGDGTLRAFNLNLANPTGEIFAEADSGYSQRWGVKSDGTILLSILDNANFAGGAPGPAKLAQYDIASRQKTAEWDLPANMVGHTVSIVDGKYYVTDFNSPLIVEVDPATGTVNPSWFTSTDWDPSISGIGGTIYDNEGGFYVSQGNKLWYLPISNGTPGTLTEVTVSGLSIIDADGISWVDSQNTLYYATNDTGDPANAGTVYKLVFSDDTTATGSVVATGFDDSSGLWYHEDDGKAYLYVLESQFGALFGINTFEPPFNIEIIPLGDVISSIDNELSASSHIKVYPNPFSQSSTFEIELSQRGNFQFQVFDLNGKIVTNEVLELQEGTNKFTYKASHLTPGFYSYRLINRQGFLTGKIVVTK